MDEKEGKEIWRILTEMFDIQASILIRGGTDYKYKRMRKRNDIIARLCGVKKSDSEFSDALPQIWYC